MDNHGEMPGQKGPFDCPLACAVSLSVSLVLASAAFADSPLPAVYESVPIQVSRGREATMDLPGGRSGANYLVIAGSLADDEAQHELQMTRTTTTERLPLERERRRDDDRWLAQVSARRAAMASRRRAASVEEVQSSAKFPQTKRFHLFIKEDDFWAAESYVEVAAELVGLGKSCIVYVDKDDLKGGAPRELVDFVVATFDHDVLPAARSVYGVHKDVDRNGRFTILITHWLGKLSGGTVSISGFVRGSDFYLDLAPPFSNQCDMMYLNSSLRPGQNLRTIIAHEYTHAITFSEHVFSSYLPGNEGRDEETWLSEALAHLAENLYGDGFSNLDYRVSTFLNSTASYRLVVPDYHKAGLWRCHGARGSTYLFLRWCVDQYGTEVLTELSQSNLQGLANLEAATLTPFPDLFRRWSVAMCLDGLEPGDAGVDALSSLDLRDRLETRRLGGPRFFTLHERSAKRTLAPTGFLPISVRAAANRTERLMLATDGNARLQVTVIRLPDDLPQLTVAVDDVIVKEPLRGRRLVIRQSGGASVRLEEIAWEWATLPQEKYADSTRTGQVYAREALSRPEIKAGEKLITDPIDLALPGAKRIVIKVIGVDEHGRRVTAWTSMDQVLPTPFNRLAAR